MEPRKYLIVSKFIIWRIVQALVVIPASMVGGVLIGLTIIGNNPVQEAVYAIHHWAEVSVRPAPVGSILKTECIWHKNASLPPSLNCDSQQVRVIPVAEAAQGASQILMKLYLVLVAFSVAGLIMFLPGSRLLGLHQVNEECSCVIF